MYNRRKPGKLVNMWKGNKVSPSNAHPRQDGGGGADEAELEVSYSCTFLSIFKKMISN